MVNVKFLTDHNAGEIEYLKGDIIKLDPFIAEQLQSHGIVTKVYIVLVSPKEAAKKKAADKKAADKKKKNK